MQKKPKKRKRLKKLTNKQLIAKLEEQIKFARSKLENRLPGSSPSLGNQIIELEQQLAIAKSHAKSKFNFISYHVVDGSYGSGKRR